MTPATPAAKVGRARVKPIAMSSTGTAAAIPLNTHRRVSARRNAVNSANWRCDSPTGRGDVSDAGGPSRRRRTSTSGGLDRAIDAVAPFLPRASIALDALEASKLVQDEPCEGRPDPALTVGGPNFAGLYAAGAQDRQRLVDWS